MLRVWQSVFCSIATVSIGISIVLGIEGNNDGATRMAQVSMAFSLFSMACKANNCK